MKQSSIDFLEDCYEAGGADQFICYTEWPLARQLHKQEIMEAFYEGMRCQNFDPNMGRAELYYNETFNTKEKL